MTTFKGVLNTLAQQGPNHVPIAGLNGGKPLVFFDYYAIPASGFADGDSFDLGPINALRKGDRFIDFHLWHEAMGSSVVATVGDDGSAARYGSALDVAAAGTAPKVGNVFGGFGYELTQDRPLRVTLSGAAPTAAKIIKVMWAVLRP